MAALLLGVGVQPNAGLFLPVPQFSSSLLEAYSYPLYTVSSLISWWHTETADGARDFGEKWQPVQRAKATVLNVEERSWFIGGEGRFSYILSWWWFMFQAISEEEGLRGPGFHKPLWCLKGLYKVSWGIAHIHFVCVPQGLIPVGLQWMLAGRTRQRTN